MADKLFVCKGAICKCTLQTTPGVLDVTSQTIKKLEGKLQATEGDITFSTPFGACKRSSPPPSCTPMLSAWNTTAKKTKVNGKLALLEISTNTCSFGGRIEITNPNQTIGKTADLPSNELVNPFKGEIHFRRKLDTGGAYALFANSLTSIVENQIYGFDWIRDVIDGNENYIEKTTSMRELQMMRSTSQIPSASSPRLNQRSLLILKGKHVHHVDFDQAKRKLNDESFYFVVNQKKEYVAEYTGSKSSSDFFNGILAGDPSIVITAVIPAGPSFNSYSEIVEYDSNRARTAIHASTSGAFTTIMGVIGGSYGSLESSHLLTSFEDLAKEFTPVKTYIDTPLGTEVIGNNTAQITLSVNQKNYYTPWLAALKADTTKLYALSFLDQTVAAGEIHFKSSSPNIKIKPDKIAASSLAVHTYPVSNQTSDTVPATNKQELEITFTDVIKTDEIIEARFFDDVKKSDPNYIGDVVGLLNVLKNEKEYELTFRYVKVYLTDNNGWLTTVAGSDDNKLPTGAGLPASMASRTGVGAHSKASQLARGKDLMDLFEATGSQQDYLKKIFKHALVDYKAPILLTDTDALAIDISEIYGRKSDTAGISFAPFTTRSGRTYATNIGFPSDDAENTFVSQIQALAKSKVNAAKGSHDGVTVALIPYTFAGLFGVSDGIGGAAQNVFVTLLMFEDILKDRATAAHEVMHSLGLYHSFPDGAKYDTFIIPKTDAETEFVQLTTENVMDYTVPARSIYKWQWKKIQDDLPDVKVKP